MTNKQIVFDILSKDTNGRYRDNDQALVARVVWDQWHKLCSNASREQREAVQSFITMLFIDQNLSKPKSIERCSRGLQNEYPGLRGNKWVERQAKADEIKTNQSKAFEL